MKKWYLRLDGEIVVDVIEFGYPGYTEVEIDTDYLPRDILGGYYRWRDGGLLLDAQLKLEVDKANLPVGYDVLEKRLVEAESTVKTLEQENAAFRMSDLDNKEAIAGLIELVLAGGVVNG